MLNRGAEVVQDTVSNPLRTNFLLGRRGPYLTAISAASFALGYLLAATVNLVFLLALLVPMILAVAYTVGSKKLVGLIGSRRLKDKLMAKNLAISVGWSLIPILVGLYFRSLSIALLALAPFIFLRLMSNTIFFDLRDVSADSQFGVRTIPVVFGERSSYRAMELSDVIAASYIVILAFVRILPEYALLLILLPAYSFFYRWASRKSIASLSFLCDFVADAEYVLWGPLIFLGKVI